MSTLQRSMDYTDRDFASLRLRLQDLVQGVFDDWSDFNTATFGNILLEMMSHVGDVLSYYQDNQAAECFIGTMSQRISAIKLAELIGYVLTGASSASGTATFSIDVARAVAVPIPIGTLIHTDDPEDPVYFRTTVAREIAAGSLSVDAAIEQAEIQHEIFQSNSEPNQRLTLNFIPFLDASTDITAAGLVFTRATSFLGALPTDRVYVTSADQEDQGHIQFGNGANGEIPSGEIDIYYKTGGGVDGNVEAGKLVVMDDALADALGTPVTISSTNAAACSGGTDRMSLEEARAKIPASLRTLTRTVTRQDFEDVATSYSGVARALMATSNEDVSIQENTGILYVVARGAALPSGRIQPAVPSTTLLAGIESEINNNKPTMVNFTWEAREAAYKIVDAYTRVYLSLGANPTTVGDAIRTALNDFFAVQLDAGVANPAIDFGANLKNAAGGAAAEIVWSDVFNVVRDTTGVRKVDEGINGLLLNLLRSSVTMTGVQFPKLGSVTIVNADTGGAI